MIHELFATLDRNIFCKCLISRIAFFVIPVPLFYQKKKCFFINYTEYFICLGKVFLTYTEIWWLFFANKNFSKAGNHFDSIFFVICFDEAFCCKSQINFLYKIGIFMMLNAFLWSLCMYCLKSMFEFYVKKNCFNGKMCNCFFLIELIFELWFPKAHKTN